MASFVATAASVVLVHRATGLSPWLDAQSWLGSALFAATLLSILGVHELAHRWAARRHGMRVTLPLFLPAPFFVGTLGAVIRLVDRPRSRTGLLEMAVAGPLAGLLVASIVLVARLAWSVPEATGELLARPGLWWLASAGIHGAGLVLTTSDPVSYAVWVGCLVTAMNLLPFGQLDGGHVVAALSPGHAWAISWITTAGLFALGFSWWPWWLWLVALHGLGARHPLEVADPGDPPTRRAAASALAAVLAFAVCFTPIPW